MSKMKFTPDWTDTPPVPGSYRSIAKQGRLDQIRTPSDKYFAQLKRDLQLDDDYFKIKQDGNQPVGPVPASNLDASVIDLLVGIVGSENVQLDDYNRVKYSYGKLAEEIVSLKRGILHEITGAAVHPRDKYDVQQIVRMCDEKKIPIYVYGGGSSCNKGFLPQKGGLTLVLNTHMNKVLEVNELNHTCRVQAGCMGPQLEDALNNAPERFQTAHRFTNGHFPQSFELSSVGGWVLTMGSGQASTYYGEPANLVLSMEMVTPVGIINTSDYPSTATGPRVMDMLKGSEGVFGVLVELTVKIFRYMPENRRYFGYMFPNFSCAVTAVREVCQGQFGLPAVFRLSDSYETEHGFQMYPQPAAVEWGLNRLGYKPGFRCVLMGTVEGERGFSHLVKRKVAKIARQYGALNIGGGISKDWEEDRYTSFLIGEAISDFDIIMDTVETPVKWDNIHQIHAAVLEFAHSVPGTLCMSHMSHFYPYGSNLYFIFGIKGQVTDYISYRTGLVDAMVRAGGSPSHHHGVGRLMHQWIEHFLGKQEMDVLRALKRHFDPNDIMNPGYQLGLNVPDELRR
ncbi:MAG: FAD-binding oxidoreductase, partial [Anaerolineales bacterium]|nr:FAD-binding oxidoreductase [Anaerolineales bacterium]